MASLLAKKLASYIGNANQTVSAGFFKSAVYPDGQQVAAIAYQNEYGTKITIPEREVTLYRSIKNDGTFNKNGRFVKAAKSNFSTTHTIPEHDVVIPPRPFFRPAIAEHKKEWCEIVRLTMKRGGTVEDALETVGLQMQGDIRDAMDDVVDPPLSAMAIAMRKKRGNNNTKPLNDTGYMRSQITHAVDSQ